MALNCIYKQPESPVAIRSIFFIVLFMVFFAVISNNIKADTDIQLNPTGCTFDEMQQFYMDELGIDREVSIVLKKQRMPEPNILGLTRPLAPNTYLIVMAKALEPSEIRITLAHELVHIRQLERGEINKKEFKKHYMNRSFEDEAFRLSLPMAIKFYTTLDCSK